MITGTLMYDIEVSVDNEEALKELERKIVEAVKSCGCECAQVDTDLEEESSESDNRE